MTEGTGGTSVLGNRVTRVEDPRFLTAGGTYCADVRDPLLDGALHATFVRSTVAHGALVGIDTSGSDPAAETAFPVSIALPPPSATTQSAPSAAAIAASTVSTGAWGRTP